MRALIVTLGRSRGSLAAVRALHRAGWTVGVGTPDGAGMVTASRGCDHRHVVPRPRGDGEGFVEAIRAAVDRCGYDVVFGGGDDWQAALAQHRDEVPVAVASPPADVVHRAIDKLELRSAAERHGLATPLTLPATPDVVRSWQGAVVVKCRAHWYFGQRHEQRIEARRFPDAAAALGRVQFLRDAGFEPLLQEPVSGELRAMTGLVHDGRLVGRVYQRSPRLWPTPNGVSSRAETLPVDDALAGRVEAMLVEMGWSGIAEVQFLAGDDGEPEVIDFNGRFYGSMALAVAAGVNLPDAWGRAVIGEPVPELPDGEPGVRYIWLAGDLRRAIEERRAAWSGTWPRRSGGPGRRPAACGIAATVGRCGI